MTIAPELAAERPGRLALAGDAPGDRVRWLAPGGPRSLGRCRHQSEGGWGRGGAQKRS